MQSNTRLLLDADAINLLSKHPTWQDRVPRGSILTPHPAEFDRLTGVHASSWERLAAMQQLSIERQWIVVLKNAFTLISDPEGRLYLTARGNTALAKAGSGDMLTGLMAAILARGTESLDAARVATWLLGRAAECATLPDADEGLLQTDVLHQLPRAFNDLRTLSRSDEFFGYF
jgi:NAD(P)H-hydrate epimerase